MHATFKVLVLRRQEELSGPSQHCRAEGALTFECQKRTLGTLVFRCPRETLILGFLRKSEISTGTDSRFSVLGRNGYGVLRDWDFHVFSKIVIRTVGRG